VVKKIFSFSNCSIGESLTQKLPGSPLFLSGLASGAKILEVQKSRFCLRTTTKANDPTPERRGEFLGEEKTLKPSSRGVD
jgi:hypothetical protein